MKKKITCSLLVVLLLTVTLLSFVGCERVDGLTMSQISDIRKTYATDVNGKFKLDVFFKTKVLKYLGTYDGKIAVRVLCGESIAKADVFPDPCENIGGVFMGELGGNELYFLYVPSVNGEKDRFCELGGAYAEGLVTKSDLEKIAEIEQGTAKK